MKLVLALLLAPALAAADDKTVALSAAHAEDKPVDVSLATSCSKAAGGLLKTRTAKSHGIDYAMKFDCDASPGSAHLVLHTGGGWFTRDGGTYQDDKRKLEHTQMVLGMLAKKTAAVILRLDVLDGDKRSSLLTVCSLEDKPRCGHVDVPCADRCADVKLDAGTLKIGGKAQYTVR